MVYRHVEWRAVCIYSQLKTVSSSEVAAMLEGLHRQKLSRPTTGQPEAYPHLMLRSQHLAVTSCGGAVRASRHLSTIFVTG
jgi:hypothetical protein